MKRGWFVAVGLLLGLLACQAEPDVRQLPTPQVIRFQLASPLDWMRPALADCAVQTGLALAEVRSAENRPAQVSLVWGDPHLPQGTLTLLGEDVWLPVVQANNPLRSVQRADLPLFWGGELQTWGDLLLECSDCMPENSLLQEPLRVWGYDPNSAEFAAWQAVAPDLVSWRALTGVAPNVAGLQEAIANDPAALGFLPARWPLMEGVRRVEWDGVPPLPVLAWTESEPQADLLAWLGCVQTMAFSTTQP